MLSHYGLLYLATAWVLRLESRADLSGSSLSHGATGGARLGYDRGSVSDRCTLDLFSTLKP